ncbi:MAG TPA: hypothetical protein DIT04_12920, partial [Dysgonomonas sp.]|nr:hypothetical protein [Dysgonomonas sp.]
MFFKGVKKYIINPSLGLLPSILYFIVFGITRDVPFSLILSIIFAGIGDIFIRIYSRTIVCSLVFLINLIAFTSTLIIWLFMKNVGVTNMFYIIIYEMFLFLLLVLSRLFKAQINSYVGQKKSTPAQKTFLSEYFEIAGFIQYMITFHLFIVIIYRYIHENINIWEQLDSVFYFVVPVIFVSIIIAYEEIKMNNIAKHLRKEEWLPIVSESGEVTGRIARSVSSKMKNRFMHPVVRVALVHNGELYLQKRPSDDSLDPDTYDHPFEKYMLFNHEINIAVRNSITRALDMQELPFNFLLKYVYENEETKRLIFLFISRVENEEQLESLSLLKGKFWTMKQIE